MDFGHTNNPAPFARIIDGVEHRLVGPVSGNRWYAPTITDTDRLDWLLKNINKKGFDDISCGITSREGINMAIKAEKKKSK